ncbi:MAG: dihydropteroate synthase [Flavobacterium sp.]|nr:dihydropteroate synthase [Flavobacterium sp.]
MLINCRGKLIDLTTPKVMGILNVTPDSFYDGGYYANEKAIINQVSKMIADGATFIDVGVYSSKPNAALISEQEELDRLLPVLDLILGHFPDVLLSIDTFRSAVARQALEKGAAMINDISAGLLDDKMMEVVAQYQVPYIMMHMRGTPQTMTTLTQYDDLMKDVLFYFSERILEARKLGINDLLIDPGFGFAKTVEQNFELLKHLAIFNSFELPLLIGISRKSMIYKTLQTTPENALNGTTALNAIAVQKGAKILRVHDVKEAVECVKLVTLLQ